MRTTGCFDRDRHGAGRTIFGDCWSIWFWALHLIERADNHENGKRDDKKVNDQRNKIPVVPRDGTGFDCGV
ncbi:MAG: hypothetical protein JWO45_1667, partial [Spartobacteria bacterium]|nr:hypothetical protein [Spartobacteria bacterium]